MFLRPLIVPLLLAFATSALADDEVTPLLEAMHAAGEELTSLESRVKLTDYDFDTAEEAIRPGTMTLVRGEAGDAIHVYFTGRATGEAGSRQFFEEPLEYLLRDGVLVDRNYRSKTEVRRTLPPEEAERDLLSLSEGPFPLPIGQEPAMVRELFDVKLVDVSADNDYAVDPIAGTTRLRLTPKPDTRFSGDFLLIEVDVDPSTGLPAQVTTVDAGEINLRIVEFLDPRLNRDGVGLPTLREVDLSTWNVTEEQL
jgi:hypothetical protein